MSSTDALLQINKLLGQLSAEDLVIVAKSAAARANSATKIALQVGDTVSFDAKSRGVKTGVLIKKNTKTFQVLVGSTTWKVSPTLLKKVA
jgi:hypothetical protein